MFSIRNFLVIALSLFIFPWFAFAKTQSRSKVVSKVNGVEVRVETNQPGKVVVENNNGEIKIKTSKGITPTIFISDKKITPILLEDEEDKTRGAGQQRKTILAWLKAFLSSIFKLVFQR